MVFKRPSWMSASDSVLQFWPPKSWPPKKYFLSKDTFYILLDLSAHHINQISTVFLKSNINFIPGFNSRCGIRCRQDIVAAFPPFLEQAILARYRPNQPGRILRSSPHHTWENMWSQSIPQQRSHSWRVTVQDSNPGVFHFQPVITYSFWGSHWELNVIKFILSFCHLIKIIKTSFGFN
jgi:hypothetical protein